MRVDYQQICKMRIHLMSWKECANLGPRYRHHVGIATHKADTNNPLSAPEWFPQQNQPNYGWVDPPGVGEIHGAKIVVLDHSHQSLHLNLNVAHLRCQLD